jgi:hypothetical protein
LARCGLKTTHDLCRIYGAIGHLAVHYHTDILGLLSMPIEALYYHFAMIKRGMEMVK